MKILAIDTTASAASAALCEDGFLIGEYFVNLKQTHSQTIMPMVKSLLDSCGVLLKDIGLFAVSCGPGSFTGVRIGVAAIKGLALPFDTPCAAVSALESLAQNVVAASNSVICAAMDARRGQFYNALFEPCGGKVKRLTPDRAISFDELEKDIQGAISLGKKVLFVGDGAKICYNNLIEKNISGIELAPQNLLYARASSVAAVGLRQYRVNDIVTPAALLPSYLRLPQAERELKKQTARAD
jgi:tRNA threonylcarbamoyladenosine biosynthesis protein TsaB